MEILSKIEGKIPGLYSQEEKSDPIVYIKLSLYTNVWLLTELNPEEKLAFGFVCLNGDVEMAELGYISIQELEDLNYEIKVEEVKQPLSKMKKELGF